MIELWSDADVRASLGLPGHAPGAYRAIQTDTRTIAADSLFVALVGERFDGHEYLQRARDAGATGAVVRAGTSAVDGLAIYEVPDTLHALGDLAAFRRQSCRGPVIGITGQNGKTSTKEMVAAVLGTRWTTYRTRANLNNLVGVPTTILEAPAPTEALVIEAGANLPGEIPRYREIICPDIAIVLNAGAGHLEGFGSVAGVLREKLALAQGAPIAVVGMTPPELESGARERAHRVITAGLTSADVAPDLVTIDSNGMPVISVDGRTFTLAARGRHQAGNAMFAWAIARHYGLDLDACALALQTLTLPGGRGEMTHHGALTVLNDSYNANPQSFTTAIALASALRTGRRLVFVAGSMRELGEHADQLHLDVAGELAQLRPDVLGVVGDFVAAFEPYRAGYDGVVVAAPDADAIGPLLAAHLRGDELVVLKGSRGVTLERALPAIVSRAASAR